MLEISSNFAAWDLAPLRPSTYLRTMIFVNDALLKSARISLISSPLSL
jgi:hypothetical protein